MATKVDDILDEIARETNLVGDDKARRMARKFGAAMVRWSLDRASILDFDRDEVSKALTAFADLLEHGH